MHIALIAPHDAAQPRPWLPGGDSGFDYEAAHREGWTVSEAAPAEPGQAGIQLQRIDSPETGDPVFADDSRRLGARRRPRARGLAAAPAGARPDR